MAKEKIKLVKKIISNKLSNKLHNKSFHNLTKSTPQINDESVKNLYDTSFYIIPKKGKNSHESIIKESTDYLYPQINKVLDDQIESLVDEIEAKNEELNKLKNPRPSNSEYPNGSFLTAGDDNGQFQGMGTVYVMQDGMKRAIGSGGMYHLIRRSLRTPGEAFSELYFLSIDELNQIPDGVTIDYQWQMSMPSFAAEYGPIYQRLPYFELHLFCEGREVDDSFDLVEGDFWLEDDNDDACTVTYIKNTFEGDPEQYSIETETINVGEKKIIEFARNDHERGIMGIPHQINRDVYNTYYDYNTDIQQTGTREWGWGKNYSGVLLAEGRIWIGNDNQGRMFNTKTNQSILADLRFDEVYGNCRKIYSSCMQLDGTFNDTCYGALNQDDELVEHFNNPTFKYYVRSITVSSDTIKDSYGTSNYGVSTIYSEIHNRNYPIYGQPILKVGGEYVVYLKSIIHIINAHLNNPSIYRHHHFYKLTDNANNGKKLMLVHDNDIHVIMNTNSTAWTTQQSIIQNAFSYSVILKGAKGYGDNRFNWEAVDTDKVKFIGLTTLSDSDSWDDRVRLNGFHVGNGVNYFNPYGMGGSNYGLSGEIQEILYSHYENEDYNDSSVPDFCPFTEAQLQQFALLSIPVGTGDLPLGCTFQNCLDC